MGANQALTDSGKLVRLFRGADFQNNTVTDNALSRLVQTFDKEMYDRAFDMVKKSEDIVGVDLSTLKGRALVAVVGTVMQVLGWGLSALEFCGLKTPEDVDYMTFRPEGITYGK